MMSLESSPQSGTSVSPVPDHGAMQVWSSVKQGPLMHWLLFQLYSKYDPEELHRILDGLVFRVLALPSASVSPSDRDAIIRLRKEPDEGQYLFGVGGEEPWQSVWPEDKIMIAIQNAAMATARHLGTTVARKAVVESGLPVDDLLSEGKLWKKAQLQGHV